MVLYLRSVLAELGYEQEHATTLFEDNRGAVLMLQASKPTRQTRHIDICNFAFLQWVDQDLLQVVDIKSAANVSDILTKQTPKPTMLRHLHNLLGLLSLHFPYG
jgi:protein tyrosine phosphatase